MADNVSKSAPWVAQSFGGRTIDAQPVYIVGSVALAAAGITALSDGGSAFIDATHYNDAGHQIWADAFKPEVQRLTT